MGFLRLYLALCVVLAHTGDSMPFPVHNGRQAVQVFYIISGFYISLILHDKYFSLKAFYLSRYLRIVPPLMFITLLICLISVVTRLWLGDWFALAPYFSDPLKNNGLTGIVLAAISNFTIFGQDILLFIKHNPGEPLSLVRHLTEAKSPLYLYVVVPQAWSIALELYFYLCAPFLCRLTTRSLVMIALVSLVLRVAAAHWLGLGHNPWNYRFFPFEVAHFVYGMLAYRLYLHYFKDRVFSNLKSGYMQWALFVIATLAALMVQRQSGIWIGSLIGTEKGLVLTGILWIPAIALAFCATSRNSADRFIGELSYPVYLIHASVITGIELLMHRGMALPMNVAYAACTISVLLAVALNHWVLNPFEQWRRRKVDAVMRTEVAG